MNYKTNIAYDFDGVLCNSTPAFHLFWKEKYGWDIWDCGQPSFNLPLPADYDMKNIHSDIKEALNKFQHYCLPYSFAMEMMREFAREYNEQPIIITARPQGNTGVTDEWLKHWLGIPFTLVHCEGHGSKAEVVAEYGIKYYVEDRFRTVNQLTSCEKVFMPDRPWNTGRTPQDFVLRVNNLVDVWDYIMND